MPDEPTKSAEPADRVAEQTAAHTHDISEGSTGPAGRSAGDAPPPPAPPGYEILGELGRGGMGAVYRARQIALNRPVALKVILAGGHASAPERIRFLQEAEAVASLDHPNVVRVYELGQHEGLPYIALEYIPGGSLGSYARSPLPPRDAAVLVEQIARGVAHAHSHHVVHRDLKPENVLLVPNEGQLPTPRVADFGLAKRLDVGTGVTATGAVMGTPSYMAPEQAGDTKHVGPPADIWAVGAILYRLLTGRPPFRADSAIETIRKVLETEPELPSRLAPGIPRPLEVICLKCLQKNPADRYPSAEAVADDLRRWLNGETLDTRLPARRGRRRNLVAAGLALLLGVGLWAAYPHLVGKPGGAPQDDPPAPGPEEQLNAIAVLPFVNASGNPEDEFLSEGISESVANSLSGVRELNVRPFSSALQFKGKGDLKEVGRRLEVQVLVTGRLTRSGDKVAVSVQLIDVGANTQSWGERFVRPVTEIHALQEDVARQVSRTLKARFNKGGEPPARRAPDPDAVLHYMKGRHYFNTSSTRAQTLLAIEEYRTAIGKDPEYALPHVALAEAYYWLSNVFEPPAEVIPKAKAAATRAVELDGTLADAHAMLGLFAAVYDWDWGRAGREFDHARELNPRSAVVHTYYAIYLSARGRYDEALRALQAARERDPSSSFVSAYPAFVHYLAGRTDEAVKLLDSQIQVDGDNYLTHAYRGLCLEQLRRYDEAVAEFDLALKLEPNTESMAQRGHILAVANRHPEARAVLQALLAERERFTSPDGSAGLFGVLGGAAAVAPPARYVSPYNIAMLYAGLGEMEQAFDWLEKAYADHSEWLSMIQADPRTKPLREHPRYLPLLRRIGLSR
jgi:serine/threonine-protein kinase